MRRLSMITYPDRYSICPNCHECFIADVSTMAIRCPNDNFSMITFEKRSDLETYIDRTGVRSLIPVPTTPPTAETSKMKESSTTA